MRLVQILSNLLSNALKYSPPDSRIEVSVWREGESAEIAVKDHGIGIPAPLPEPFFAISFIASWNLPSLSSAR